VSLAILLLPHDSVLPNVPHHARNERVITLVHMHWMRQTVSDAGHARCNTETEWLKGVKSTDSRRLVINCKNRSRKDGRAFSS
jgi:hypothetical protein